MSTLIGQVQPYAHGQVDTMIATFNQMHDTDKIELLARAAVVHHKEIKMLQAEGVQRENELTAMQGKNAKLTEQMQKLTNAQTAAEQKANTLLDTNKALAAQVAKLNNQAGATKKELDDLKAKAAKDQAEFAQFIKELNEKLDLGKKETQAVKETQAIETVLAQYENAQVLSAQKTKNVAAGALAVAAVGTALLPTPLAPAGVIFMALGGVTAVVAATGGIQVDPPEFTEAVEIAELRKKHPELTAEQAMQQVKKRRHDEAKVIAPVDYITGEPSPSFSVNADGSIQY